MDTFYVFSSNMEIAYKNIIMENEITILKPQTFGVWCVWCLQCLCLSGVSSIFGVFAWYITRNAW